MCNNTIQEHHHFYILPDMMFRNSSREENPLSKLIHYQTLRTVHNLGQNMVGILMWIGRLKFCNEFWNWETQDMMRKLDSKICYYIWNTPIDPSVSLALRFPLRLLQTTVSIWCSCLPHNWKRRLVLLFTRFRLLVSLSFNMFDPWNVIRMLKSSNDLMCEFQFQLSFC